MADDFSSFKKVGKHYDPRPELSSADKFRYGMSDPNRPNLWNVVHGLQGAFQEANMNNIMVQPARGVMEGLGIGMDEVKKLYPGQSDEFYKKKLHEHYNMAIRNARAEGTAKKQANPYPGQTVANFGAGVLGSADPTWFVNPASAAKTAPARIAQQAGFHAGLSGAADAAAQGLDVATGTTDGYDINRGLTATAFGGVFGGGFQGLGELGQVPAVSRFVSDLFKARGSDITPKPNPLNPSSVFGPDGRLNATGGDQLKALTRSGSVPEIESFLTQNSRPQFRAESDIAKLQQSLPENFIGKDRFDKAAEATIAKQHFDTVTRHVDELTKTWKNKPDVEFISKVDDIADEAVRNHARSEGADDPNALGFVGPDGKVRIFHERMDSPDTLNAVLYHEALGHYGLQQQFGAKLDSTLQSLMDRNVGKFKTDVDLWMKANPGAYGGNRLRAAEEVLAEASQNGRIKAPWVDALVAAIRGFGRKMGMKLSYSDAEINYILSMAHNAVINGKGRNVPANGFRGADPRGAIRRAWAQMGVEPDANRFMYIGQKAKNFDPEAGFVANDGFRRNEISDHQATIGPKLQEMLDGTANPNGYMRLDEAINHSELFDNYPELAETYVVRRPPEQMMEGAKGTYDPETKWIEINSDMTDPRNVLRTVLHETQHRIQDHEGYPGFDRTEAHSSVDAYRNDPLEVEAHSTERRSSMGPDMRERIGTPKFMNRNQLATDGSYQIKQIEEAYNAMERDYTPEVRPWAEVRREALDAGFTPSQIKDFGKGPDLSKRLYRMQAAAKVLDMRITDTLAKVDTPDWSVRDADNLRQMLVDHAYILNKLRGERAEAARALNISKVGYTRSQMQSYGKMLQEEGGTMAPLGDEETLLKFARQLKQMQQTGNQPGMNAMVNSLNKPHWEDYVITLHNNMMLSGLSTHVKAPMDMVIGIGRELMDSAGALPMAAGREALRAMGVKVKPGVHPTEVAARLWGVMKAGMDAHTYRNAMNTFVTGTNNAAQWGGRQNARIPLVSKIGDFITAQDAFFRAFATNMHLYGLGTRQALNELKATGTKYTWDDVMTLGANHARNPSKALLDEAKELTDQTLLLNRNALTEPLDRLKRTAPDSSALRRATAFIANYLTPFIRTAANSLVNRTIRRSPLAFLDPQTIRELKAGGAAADTAMSRIILGTAAIATYWALANDGKITGSGPQNPAKRKEKMASGWRPNAVVEPDQYNTGGTLPLSLNPFDPHNQTASMIADLNEAYRRGADEGQVANGLKLAFMSSLRNMAEMSWIGDIAPAIKTITEPGLSAEYRTSKFIADELSSFVPNLSTQLVKSEDQQARETIVPESVSESTTNAFKEKLPFTRDDLPVRHDVYGQPLQTGTTPIGVHSWLPQDNRTVAGNHFDRPTDPAIQELVRLGDMVESTLVSPVQRTVTINGIKTKLNNEQFQEYQRLAGQAIVETVRAEMSTPEWQAMSDQDKVLEVRDIVKDMKKAAREALYGPSEPDDE